MTAARTYMRKVRPRRWPMTIIGLTGSIAMGKSTASAFLARLGIPVFNADTAVHELLGPHGAAVGPVSAHFPAAKTGAAIDRAALSKIVFGDPAALRALESILHPMVRGKRAQFFQRAALRRSTIVAVEIPLLLENPIAEFFDMIVVVSAPAFLQRQRALRRPGMTAARLDAILARQMPDAVKRRRADAVIPSGLGKRETLRRLKRSLKVHLSSRGGAS
jgi:dephospho-CoA kinase